MKIPPEIRKQLFHINSQRRRILLLAKKNRTPFYLFDKKQFVKNVQMVKQTFEKHLPGVSLFYAMKSNPHDFLLKNLVSLGVGIDVSGAGELRAAIAAGAKKIIFTGPGKTKEELQLAIKQKEKVTLILDSFTELRRLREVMANSSLTPVIGVRVVTSRYGDWNKFGIKLTDLKRFIRVVAKVPSLRFSGIQFHMSFNMSAEPYLESIKEVAEYLKAGLSLPERNRIKFIDIGGGFMTDDAVLNFRPADFPTVPAAYYSVHFRALDDFVRPIGLMIKNSLAFLPNCVFYAEPGRLISTPAMHIVLRVLDVKDNCVITDGATNMVGWEKFEEDYAPVVNLTHPSPREKKQLTYGSLCTPHDIWGFFCFAKKVAVGDILVIPNQGAYVYTFAQNFIKEIPPVYEL
ncbi:alanine racemase [Candidatus Roizmanbacteria bacterium]|nr:alanine racemase [Candidatus Roizmanbacteria bacterium]